MVLTSSKIPSGAGLLPGVRVREVVICVVWGGQRDTCAAARYSAGTAQTSTGPARLLGAELEGRRWPPPALVASGAQAVQPGSRPQWAPWSLGPRPSSGHRSPVLGTLPATHQDEEVWKGWHLHLTGLPQGGHGAWAAAPARPSAAQNWPCPAPPYCWLVRLKAWYRLQAGDPVSRQLSRPVPVIPLLEALGLRCALPPPASGEPSEQLLVRDLSVMNGPSKRVCAHLFTPLPRGRGEEAEVKEGLCPAGMERSLPKVESLLSPLPAWAQEDSLLLLPICAQNLLSLGLGPEVPNFLCPFKC